MDAVLALVKCSLAENPNGFNPNPAESYRDFFIRAMRMRGQHVKLGKWHGKPYAGDCLVAELRGKIVGVGTLDSEGMHKSYNKRFNTAEVARVHVSSDYKGKGYGNMLVNALNALAKHLGFKTTILHVTNTENQQPAIRLYERMGYERMGQETYFVDKEYDTISMKLDLHKHSYALDIVDGKVRCEFALDNEDRIIPAPPYRPSVKVLTDTLRYEGFTARPLASIPKSEKSTISVG